MKKVTFGIFLFYQMNILVSRNFFKKYPAQQFPLHNLKEQNLYNIISAF